MKRTFSLVAIFIGRSFGIEYIGNNGGTDFPLGLCQGGKGIASDRRNIRNHILVNSSKRRIQQTVTMTMSARGICGASREVARKRSQDVMIPQPTAAETSVTMATRSSPNEVMTGMALTFRLENAKGE